MIVEYLEAGFARPYVRGAFVADLEVDELLRQSEPKAHDSWQMRPGEGTPLEASEAADHVIRRVKDHVRKFRERLRPAARPAEDVRLPELDKLFSRIFSESGSHSPAPPAGERPFSIQIDQRVVPAGNGLIQLKGKASYALAQTSELTSAEADLALSYRFVEEGGTGEEAKLKIAAAPGFSPDGDGPYRFVGTLTHNQVTVSFESDPYPADWSGRLKADAELLKAEGSSHE